MSLRQTARWYMLWCHANKRSLKGKNALEYIRWGEQQGYHERPSCRTRRPWYGLKGPTAPNLLWPSAFFERYICYECPKGLVADKVFYTIAAPDLSIWTKAFLNSSVVALLVEVEGYQLNHGGIFVTTEWLANLSVLASSTFEVEEIYSKISSREILLYANEANQADRVALDAAVLRALGLSEDLLNELHATVASYIRNRIAKARRNVTQRGRQEA